MNLKFLMQAIFLVLAGSVMTIPAFAEWQWLDKEGQKVFSDRPPPPDIPQKSILKSSEFKALTPQQGLPPALPATMASAPANKNSMPMLSGKDAELEARKKQASMLEEAKKQTETEKLSSARAENCERAKKGQAALKSGVRIALINAKGEREFMDDAARSVETKRLQTIADSDCAK